MSLIEFFLLMKANELNFNKLIKLQKENSLRRIDLCNPTVIPFNQHQLPNMKGKNQSRVSEKEIEEGK